MITAFQNNYQLIQAKEKMQILLTDLLLRNVQTGAVQDNALEAIGTIEDIPKEHYHELIDPIEDWRIKWAMMIFWVLVNTERSAIQ